MRRPAPDHYAWETLARTGWKVGVWVVIAALGLLLFALLKLLGMYET